MKRLACIFFVLLFLSPFVNAQNRTSGIKLEGVQKFELRRGNLIEYKLLSGDRKRTGFISQTDSLFFICKKDTVYFSNIDWVQHNSFGKLFLRGSVMTVGYSWATLGGIFILMGVASNSPIAVLGGVLDVSIGTAVVISVKRLKMFSYNKYYSPRPGK